MTQELLDGTLGRPNSKLIRFKFSSRFLTTWGHRTWACSSKSHHSHMFLVPLKNMKRSSSVAEPTPRCLPFESAMRWTFQAAMEAFLGENRTTSEAKDDGE